MKKKKFDKDINVRSKTELTDEEIIRDLNYAIEVGGDADTPPKEILDLIHRLQDENKRKTDRLYEMCNNEHDNLMKIREQKAEIERLTRENKRLIIENATLNTKLMDYEKGVKTISFLKFEHIEVE